LKLGVHGRALGSQQREDTVPLRLYLPPEEHPRHQQDPVSDDEGVEEDEPKEDEGVAYLLIAVSIDRRRYR